MILLILILNFNSIKVQLKPYQQHKGLIDKLFQFHKGTIKTPVDAFQHVRIKFQFHKGTIKTNQVY